MTTVASTDPNLEFRDAYDLFRQVYFNQEPFTGLLKCGNEETEYVNGNAHGKYTVLFEDGSIHTKAIFQNGEEFESVSYYNTLIKKYRAYQDKYYPNRDCKKVTL